MIAPNQFFEGIGRAFWIVVLCWLGVDLVIGILKWLSN
jgi:hypothetical protein